MCTENTLKKILDCVAESSREIFGDKLHSAILFGSYARGDFDDESDIDILLVANLPAEKIASYRGKIDELCGFLLFEYGIVVSITEKDAYTFNRYADILPFYRNICKEGVKIA